MAAEPTLPLLGSTAWSLSLSFPWKGSCPFPLFLLQPPHPQPVRHRSGTLTAEISADPRGPLQVQESDSVGLFPFLLQTIPLS